MLKQFPNWFINIFCVCMCACSSIQEVLTSKASWPVSSGTAQTEMNGHASPTCLLDAAAWVSLLQWSPVPGACRRKMAMTDPHSRMVTSVQASSVNVGAAAFHKQVQCIKNSSMAMEMTGIAPWNTISFDWTWMLFVYLLEEQVMLSQQARCY